MNFILSESGRLLWKELRHALIAAGYAGPGQTWVINEIDILHHLLEPSSFIWVLILPTPIFPQEPKYLVWCWLPTAYNCGTILRLLSPSSRPCWEKKNLLSTTVGALYMLYIIYSSKQPDEVYMLCSFWRWSWCLWRLSIMLVVTGIVSFSFQCSMLND